MTTTIRCIISILLLLLLVAVSANAQTQYVVDTKTTLLVRTGPGKSYNQLGQTETQAEINPLQNIRTALSLRIL